MNKFIDLIPIKFHLEDNKVIYDEEIVLRNGDMIVEEGIWIEGEGIRVEKVFIQRNTFKSKWTMTVNGKEVQ